MKNRCRILSAMLAAVLSLLFCLPCALADGEASWDSASASWDPNAQAYLYDGEHYGIVLCIRMNVRNAPSTGARAYGMIRNGQPVRIVGVTDNRQFYLLDLESCGFGSAGGGVTYGYAKSSLIKMDPEFIATTGLTNLYATPWSREKKNGEQTNRFFLVIEAYDNWYAVQATETSPGTAFIRIQDVGRYNNGYQNLRVVTWDTDLYEEGSWARSRSVSRFSVGNVISRSYDSCLMVFNEGTASEFRGWIRTQYTAPIIN